MEKLIYLCTIVLGISIVGCSAPYSPNTLQHTYVTDTQTHHELTGLRIEYSTDDEGQAHAAMSQALLLTRHAVEWLVDGRHLARHNVGSDFRTFVQLPPGRHRLVMQETAQGVGTLGMKSSGNDPMVYDFEIGMGQVAIFRAKGVSWCVVNVVLFEEFDNVVDFRCIDGCRSVGDSFYSSGCG